MAEVGANESTIEIIDKRETVSRLYQLVDQADRRLLLISPYVSLDKLGDLFRALERALDRKTVRVTLVGRYCPDQGNYLMKSDRLPSLVAKGLEAHVAKDLHAKMYISEKHALVTSLNLTDSSMINSIEVGVWLAAGTSPYRDLTRLWKQQVEPAQIDVDDPNRSVQTSGRRMSRAQRRTDDEGLEGCCIRCGTDIELDEGKPFCRECYTAFSKRGSRTTRQKFCHECGRKEGTSLAKPLCDDCFYGYF